VTYKTNLVFKEAALSDIRLQFKNDSAYVVNKFIVYQSFPDLKHRSVYSLQSLIHVFKSIKVFVIEI
jgi:hypothetical protein